jgi:hypothetical protein
MPFGLAPTALCMVGALVFSMPAQAYDCLFSYDTAAVSAAGGLNGEGVVAFTEAFEDRAGFEYSVGGRQRHSPNSRVPQVHPRPTDIH